MSLCKIIQKVEQESVRHNHHWRLDRHTATAVILIVNYRRNPCAHARTHARTTKTHVYVCACVRVLCVYVCEGAYVYCGFVCACVCPCISSFGIPFQHWGAQRWLRENCATTLILPALPHCPLIAPRVARTMTHAHEQAASTTVAATYAYLP